MAQSASRMITELATNALEAGRTVRVVVTGVADPIKIQSIETNDTCVRFVAEDRYWTIRADALIGFEAWPKPSNDARKLG